MITIYGDKRSGNCFKIQLICALLQIEHHYIDIDLLKGDTKSPEFLNKAPVGKIPIIELEDGRVLSESNAIINFLARGSALYPDDSFVQAKIQQWQFFEQYSHEPYIAVARFIQHYLGLPEDRRKQYERKHPPGYKALDIMDNQLANTNYLVGDECSTADIALYAYTHVAHEGGFDLTRFSHIKRWLKQIEDLPGYVAMNY